MGMVRKAKQVVGTVLQVRNKARCEGQSQVFAVRQV